MPRRGSYIPISAQTAFAIVSGRTTSSPAPGLARPTSAAPPITPCHHRRPRPRVYALMGHGRRISPAGECRWFFGRFGVRYTNLRLRIEAHAARRPLLRSTRSSLCWMWRRAVAPKPVPGPCGSQGPPSCWRSWSCCSRAPGKLSRPIRPAQRDQLPTRRFAHD
jgi:hypothetical protein